MFTYSQYPGERTGETSHQRATVTMSEQELKQLLNKLHQALEGTKSIDTETLQMVRELEQDLDRLTDHDSGNPDFDSLKGRAQALEARFAVEHPAAERFVRELIDLLAKVGI